MKKFIVDAGKKKYIVKANDAKRAVELVKKINDAGWFNLTIIELEDSSELTLTKLVKDVKKIVRHRVAEITNGRFDADVLRLQVLVVEDGRTTKFNWMEVPIAYRLSLKALRELSAEDEHKVYKVQSEIKAKLKQFAGKQIYKDKSIATDSFEDAPKITQLSRNFGRVRVLERDGYFEIEWPTLGKVYTEDAEEFLRDLQNAMNYVNKMKARFGYK